MSYPEKAVLERLPGLIYISNNAAKTIQWCNKNLEKVSGYSLDEMKEMGSAFFGKVMHPDDLAQALLAQKQFNRNSDCFYGYCRIKGRNEEAWKWVSGVAVPYSYDGAGTVKEVICNFQVLRPIDTPRQMHLAFNFMIKKELKNRVAGLRRREKEVLELLLKGKSNKEIACTLFISVDTVKTHKAHIRIALGAESLHLLIDLAVFCDKVLE